MYRILVVEDEKMIRKGIIYGFDYESMNCIIVGEARDGEEGVSQIKALKPDIVITDINMPVMDAFEMLDATLDFSYSTIILSGYDEFSNAQKAIKYGVSEFIVKPIEKDEMEEALKRAIAQRDMLNNIQQVKGEREDYRQLQVLPEIPDVKLDGVVSEMIDYVKEHYSEKFVFEDVAKTIGYSPNYLYKSFKKYTSLTFNDYLNRYRIQKAIDLMLTTDKKIYEISYECGFKEYKYFNKVFKKYVGVSATDYVDIVHDKNFNE